MTAWWLVLVAVLLEIGWAVGLPMTDGFTRPIPTVLVVAAMIAVLLPLSVAARTLPIGSLYAVWTGLGAVGTAILAASIHGEPITATRVVGIAAVVTGVVALKWFDPVGASEGGVSR